MKVDIADVGEEEDDADVSDDDVVKEGAKQTWFGMGMMGQEKIEARRPWRNNLIIKLIGRFIGYHYLLKRIPTMWKT